MICKEINYMNTELKNTLETLLYSRNVMYSLFHKLTGTPMHTELMNTITSENTINSIALLESNENGFAKDFIEFIKHYDNSSDEAIDKISDEYTRLFVGPARLVAPPWESVYTSIDHTLFQLSTLSVRLWFNRYQLQTDQSSRIADDHIALMMHFLSYTSQLAAEALTENNVEKTRMILVDQSKFQNQHLLNWILTYEKALQKSSSFEFYPQMIHHLVQFIELDHQLIDEMIALI